MGITINFPVDELQLDDLIADGWTTLKLYYSNSPEGPYTDSGTSPNQDLATANTAGPPHLFTFGFSGGNAAQWFKVVAYNGSTTSSLNDAQAFHGGGGTTLQAIRQKMGKLMKLMHVGTTDSTGAGDGSTAICTTSTFRRFRDNYFGGGTGVDGWFFNNLSTSEWTVINGWTQSTGLFNFSPSLSAQVGSGVNFEVMARWTPDEYRDAINWAIEECYPTLSKPVVDTSLSTIEDANSNFIFQYTIPFNIRILNKVEIEDTNNSDNTDSRIHGMPWRQISYGEIDDGLTRSIEFKQKLDVDRRLRFTGTSFLSQLYNDSDYVEIVGAQVNLLVYRATERLYSAQSNIDPSSDVDRWRDQASYYLALYNENKGKRATRRKSKKMWQHDAQWNTY